MIPELRSEFNRLYKESQYLKLLRWLEATCGTSISFRVAETPCFFPEPLLRNMAQIGKELTRSLIDDPEYLRASELVIPAGYRVDGNPSHPNFMTVDFGLVRGSGGDLEPRLVELQAFPSVFAYQHVLAEGYRHAYGLDPALNAFLGGHTEDSFWSLLSQVVLGGHDPANVVLAEIDPYNQKTLPDFLIISKRLGIQIVDVRDLIPVKQAGALDKPHYARGGKLVPVHRIYNRVIVDELIRREIALPFDYTGQFDVEWAGHPNWYFQISKFSIPYLKHRAVPPAVFLDDWLAGKDRDRLPDQRSSLILKPLFSFAGYGIKFAPSDADLAAIPIGSRHDYILQERVHFEPVVATPHGMTQAEVRIMYVWPDGGQMEPVISLIRLGRGMMMGVDHNRDQEWVGGSASFSPTKPG